MGWKRIAVCGVFAGLMTVPAAAQSSTQTPAPRLLPTEVCTSNSAVITRAEQGVYDVYLTDGNTHTNLTHDDAREYFAAASPDLRQIAFSSDRRRSVTELYVMDAKGENVRPLTSDGLTKGFFSWSLDARHIAYVTYPELDTEALASVATRETLAQQPSDLFIVNVESGEITQLTDDLRGISTVAWNAPMTQIAVVGVYEGTNGIFTISPDGGAVQPVAALDGAAYASSLVWSPDSRQLAYNTLASDGSHGIAVVNVETGEIATLPIADESQPSIFMSWTSDSSGIIRLLPQNGITYELVNLASGEVTPLPRLAVQGNCLLTLDVFNAVLTEQAAEVAGS